MAAQLLDDCEKDLRNTLNQINSYQGALYNAIQAIEKCKRETEKIDLSGGPKQVLSRLFDKIINEAVSELTDPVDVTAIQVSKPVNSNERPVNGDKRSVNRDEPTNDKHQPAKPHEDIKENEEKKEPEVDLVKQRSEFVERLMCSAGPKEGRKYQVEVITSLDKDGTYWARPVSDNFLADKIEPMSDYLRKDIRDSSLWTVENLDGLVCVKSTDTKLFLRARIEKKANNNKVRLRFVDYGTVEECEINRLCKVPPSFLDIPYMAFRCSLTEKKYNLGYEAKWDFSDLTKKQVLNFQCTKVFDREGETYCTGVLETILISPPIDITQKIISTFKDTETVQIRDSGPALVGSRDIRVNNGDPSITSVSEVIRKSESDVSTVESPREENADEEKIAKDKKEPNGDEKSVKDGKKGSKKQLPPITIPSNDNVQEVPAWGDCKTPSAEDYGLELDPLDPTVFGGSDNEEESIAEKPVADTKIDEQVAETKLDELVVAPSVNPSHTVSEYHKKQAQYEKLQSVIQTLMQQPSFENEDYVRLTCQLQSIKKDLDALTEASQQGTLIDDTKIKQAAETEKKPRISEYMRAQARKKEVLNELHKLLASEVIDEKTHMELIEKLKCLNKEVLLLKQAFEKGELVNDNQASISNHFELVNDNQAPNSNHFERSRLLQEYIKTKELLHFAQTSEEQAGLVNLLQFLSEQLMKPPSSAANNLYAPTLFDQGLYNKATVANFASNPLLSAAPNNPLLHGQGFNSASNVYLQSMLQNPYKTEELNAMFLERQQSLLQLTNSQLSLNSPQCAAQQNIQQTQLLQQATQQSTQQLPAVMQLMEGQAKSQSTGDLQKQQHPEQTKTAAVPAKPKDKHNFEIVTLEEHLKEDYQDWVARELVNLTHNYLEHPKAQFFMYLAWVDWGGQRGPAIPQVVPSMREIYCDETLKLLDIDHNLFASKFQSLSYGPIFIIMLLKPSFRAVGPDRTLGVLQVLQSPVRIKQRTTGSAFKFNFEVKARFISTASVKFSWHRYIKNRYAMLMTSDEARRYISLMTHDLQANTAKNLVKDCILNRSLNIFQDPTPKPVMRETKPKPLKTEAKPKTEIMSSVEQSSPDDELPEENWDLDLTSPTRTGHGSDDEGEKSKDLETFGLDDTDDTQSLP